MYYNDYLAHYGIKGQKWGVRRYQNKDGSLTSAGRRRKKDAVASDKEAVVKSGSRLYRVSSKGTSDTSSNKIYVSTDKETGDYYIRALGSGKIYDTGKAYAQKYIATKDLKMPDKKTMEKIELGLLSDKEVQKELVDSLMKKGLSREEATEQVRPYDKGKAFVQKVDNIAIGAYGGAIAGATAGVMTGTGIGLAVGAGAGAVAGGIVGSKVTSEERERALDVARVSYGDVNNKTINSKLQKELSAKGYNAMKDYNDRRAFGKNGEHAIIVFDSKNNIKFDSAKQITAKDYANAYAKTYLKTHPKSKLSYNDLLKDGEKEYNDLYDQGVIDRAQKKENEKILKRAKK